MRIPCPVEKLIGFAPFPFVTFFIAIDAFHVARVAKALVDPGSPFTVLSPRDAISFQLPITNWRKGDIVQLAGFKFFGHPLGNVTLSFRDEQGAVITAIADVKVLVPTTINKQVLGDVKHIPGIIGNDFLKQHKFSLYFNPSSEIAYLERQ